MRRGMGGSREFHIMTLSKLKTDYLAVAAAGALGLFLAASPASAADDEYVDDPAYAEQDNGTVADEEYADPNDVSDAGDMDETAVDAADDADDTQLAEADMEVVVSAPRMRVDPDPTLRQGRMTESRAVSFADLDLRSRAGAHELRSRVREAADEICGSLADAYPADVADYGTCYRESVRNGLVRANAAITDARHYAYRR
jgi:UrcA family protein